MERGIIMKAKFGIMSIAWAGMFWLVGILFLCAFKYFGFSSLLYMKLILLTGLFLQFIPLVLGMLCALQGKIEKEKPKVFYHAGFWFHVGLFFYSMYLLWRINEVDFDFTSVWLCFGILSCVLR
jgi:hypothetical protein